MSLDIPPITKPIGKGRLKEGDAAVCVKCLGPIVYREADCRWTHVGIKKEKHRAEMKPGSARRRT